MILSGLVSPFLKHTCTRPDSYVETSGDGNNTGKPWEEIEWCRVADGLGICGLTKR